MKNTIMLMFRLNTKNDKNHGIFPKKVDQIDVFLNFMEIATKNSRIPAILT